MNEVSVVQNELNVQEIKITRHALERFMLRYQKITGESLTIEQAFEKIRQTLASAVLEIDEENPGITRRRERYGNGRYLVNPPWRFVLDGDRVMTCEIFPEFFMQVSNPKIQAENRRARFYVIIVENPAENSTIIMKSWTASGGRLPRSVIQFPEIVEINAIIRIFRAIGIKACYEKLREGGKTEGKSCFLEVVIPPVIANYKIDDIPQYPRLVRITLGIEALLPLGRKYILCVGITKRRIE